MFISQLQSSSVIRMLFVILIVGTATAGCVGDDQPPNIRGGIMPVLEQFLEAKLDQNNKDIVYPICVYAGTEDGVVGAIPENPEFMVDVMESVVNEWNKYLYGYRNYPVKSITFDLVAENENECVEGNLQPYILYSHPTLKGAFGGMALRMRMNFPGNTINSTNPNSYGIYLHEHGHIIGLNHTTTELSVMNYDHLDRDSITITDIAWMRAMWDRICTDRDICD